MITITDEVLAELDRFDKLIQKLARKFKLDFYPQEFDIVSAEKMAEIMAYSFPESYHHWSGGRNFERQKTLWRLDRSSLPYEVVFSTNPSRAYLCETDPFAILVLTMAHVYGHNDFGKNNFWEKTSREDITRLLGAAHQRFEGYEKEHGFEMVEKIITDALAIQFNVDPFNRERPDFETIVEQKIKEARAEARAKNSNSDFDVQKLRKELRASIPFEPDRDVIGFIAEHSKFLEPWQRDILTIVREQAHCLYPIIRTKIMNEGWASFWHEKIMFELIKAQLISNEDREIFFKFQSRVLASHPLHFNPYVVGRDIWKYIERTHGLDKAFDIRATMRDIEFIDTYLVDEVIHDLKLYVYEEVPAGDYIYYVVTEKRPRIIREMLVNSLKRSPGIPIISVLRANHNKTGELYLYHHYDDDPEDLDAEYCAKTLEHIFALWGKTVWLESKQASKEGRPPKPVIYSYDGKEHQTP